MDTLFSWDFSSFRRPQEAGGAKAEFLRPESTHNSGLRENSHRKTLLCFCFGQLACRKRKERGLVCQWRCSWETQTINYKPSKVPCRWLIREPSATTRNRDSGSRLHLNYLHMSQNTCISQNTCTGQNTCTDQNSCIGQNTCKSQNTSIAELLV